MNGDVARLEAERLRPSPRDLDRTDELFRQILDLIAAECRRKGWLPAATGTTS
jgi:hypothetical protein